MTQHDSSIGGPGTQDGIAGSRSGTEGATSGQGVDKGKSEQRSDPGPAQNDMKEGGGMGGNRSDPRQSSGPGVMEKDPRDNAFTQKI